METNNKITLPEKQSKQSIYNLFINNICKDNEVWIKGERLFININYRITDPKYNGENKIIPEKDGMYTESPIIEINDVDKFQTALFDYVKAYVNLNSNWTRPYDNDWMNIAEYGMSVIWTNATNQDFTNPIDFLERYTSFLTQDQWEDLKEEQESESINDIVVWKKVTESYYERETPHEYLLFIKDQKGQKMYFPSICYGIKDDKAYIYAIHKIHGKNQQDNDDLKNIRNYIKGRGVEPLGIAALMSFIEESKRRGITKIIMPDNFIMQYTSKNRLIQQEIEDWYEGLSLEKIEQKIIEKEIQLDYNHSASLNNRLMTMFLISKYYSTGLRFLEIPGEVSDNLAVDIQNYKAGREVKKQEDRRRKAKTEEER